MADRPLAEIDITEHRVQALLLEQAPELSSLSLTLVGRGWDNTNWRLGDDLMVRVPHRQVAAVLIDHEQRWLPELAPVLNLPIPAPVVAGTASPAIGFPWPWSIVPWFPGSEACATELTDPHVSADKLGTFFAQLHMAAPADAPPHPHRGGPLQEKQEIFAERVQQLEAKLGDQIDSAEVRRVFAEAIDAAPTSERVWLHGDLHTRNMVAHNGVLSAVIDWGDMCAGDRATDLAGAFMLVPDHVDHVQAAAGADDAAWQRGRGWAVHFAVLYLLHSDDDPTMRRIGTHLLAALGVEVH